VIGLFIPYVTFDESLAATINDLKHLQRLGGYDAKFKPGFFKLLKSHPTLEVIDLAGTVDPAVVQQLPEGPPIKELRIGAENLTPADAEALAQMNSLRAISLAMGLPKPGVISALQKAKNLETLGVGSLPLTAEDLTGFTSLKSLTCAVPPNAEPFFEALAKMKGLRSLSLMLIPTPGMPATLPPGVSKIASLTELTDLSLRFPIGDANLKAFASLKNLESLDTNSDGLTEAGIRALKELPKLNSLSLQNNDVAKREKVVLPEAAFAVLKDLKGLKTLRLPSATLPKGGMEVIGSLSDLESLNLAGVVPKGDDVAAAVGKLTKLRYLNLQDAGLTDAGFKHLEGLKHLEQLFIGMNKNTRAGLDSLRMAVPTAQIISGAVFSG
jgi:hypothetical protein